MMAHGTRMVKTKASNLETRVYELQAQYGCMYPSGPSLQFFNYHNLDGRQMSMRVLN